jgi:hypothetical protein
VIIISFHPALRTLFDPTSRSHNRAKMFGLKGEIKFLPSSLAIRLVSRFHTRHPDFFFGIVDNRIRSTHHSNYHCWHNPAAAVRNPELQRTDGSLEAERVGNAVESESVAVGNGVLSLKQSWAEQEQELLPVVRSCHDGSSL